MRGVKDCGISRWTIVNTRRWRIWRSTCAPPARTATTTGRSRNRSGTWITTSRGSAAGCTGRIPTKRSSATPRTRRKCKSCTTRSGKTMIVGEIAIISTTVGCRRRPRRPRFRYRPLRPRPRRPLRPRSRRRPSRAKPARPTTCRLRTNALSIASPRTAAARAATILKMTCVARPFPTRVT